MSTSKKKNLYIIAILSLLLVAVFCIQSSFAYFTDTDVIGSNQVNVPNITGVYKIGSTNMDLSAGETNVYTGKTSTTTSNNNLSVTITTNIPVILRFKVIVGDTINDIAIDSTKFEKTDDEFYYYKSLINASETISIGMLNSQGNESVIVESSIVQGNYYGLGAMLGYVQGQKESSIDYTNKTIVYTVSRKEVNNTLTIVGYNKPKEILDITSISSKNYSITAYGFTVNIKINVVA